MLSQRIDTIEKVSGPFGIADRLGIDRAHNMRLPTTTKFDLRTGSAIRAIDQ